MPLTAKGETIKAALESEYGKEKGERVLYAGKNKGTFTGIDAAGGLTASEEAEYRRLRNKSDKSQADKDREAELYEKAKRAARDDEGRPAREMTASELKAELEAGGMSKARREALQHALAEHCMGKPMLRVDDVLGMVDALTANIAGLKSRMDAYEISRDSEITGKVVMSGGEWWYRKPNETLRHGPFKTASEAAATARSAGVMVDDACADADNATVMQALRVAESKVNQYRSEYPGLTRRDYENYAFEALVGAGLASGEARKLISAAMS